MVHGQARHSKSQGSIECLNRMLESKLGIWMQENNTTRWSFGQTIVRWQINSNYALSVGQQPHFWHLSSARASAFWACPLRRSCWRSLPPMEAELNKCIGLREDAYIEEATTAKISNDRALEVLESIGWTVTPLSGAVPSTSSAAHAPAPLLRHASPSTAHQGRTGVTCFARRSAAVLVPRCSRFGGG
eukprot:6185085-Pleurochrysis_carterae.AAC.1